MHEPTHAKITFGKYGTKRIVTLADARQIATLLSFFPNAGTGAEAQYGGLWAAWIKIEATDKDGAVMVVFVHGALKAWSEGHGDWPTKPGLREFLRKVIGEDVIAPWARSRWELLHEWWPFLRIRTPFSLLRNCGAKWRR